MNGTITYIRATDEGDYIHHEYFVDTNGLYRENEWSIDEDKEGKLFNLCVQGSPINDPQMFDALKSAHNLIPPGTQFESIERAEVIIDGVEYVPKETKTARFVPESIRKSWDKIWREGVTDINEGYKFSDPEEYLIDEFLRLKAGELPNEAIKNYFWMIQEKSLRRLLRETVRRFHAKQHQTRP